MVGVTRPVTGAVANSTGQSRGAADAGAMRAFSMLATAIGPDTAGQSGPARRQCMAGDTATRVGDRADDMANAGPPAGGSGTARKTFVKIGSMAERAGLGIKGHRHVVMPDTNVVPIGALPRRGHDRGD